MTEDDLSRTARLAGYLLVTVCTVLPIGVLAPLGYARWLHGEAASTLASGGVHPVELLGFLLAHPDVFVVSTGLFFLATRAFSAVGPGALGPGRSHAADVGDGSDAGDGAGGVGGDGFDGGGFDGGE